MGCPNNRYIDNHKCDDGWISVEDRKPVGNMVVKVKVDDGVTPPYETLGYMKVNWSLRHWFIKDNEEYHEIVSPIKVTHWKEHRVTD